MKAPNLRLARLDLEHKPVKSTSKLPLPEAKMEGARSERTLVWRSRATEDAECSAIARREGERVGGGGGSCGAENG